MTKKNWQGLLKRLELNGTMSELVLADPTTLDEFESKHGIKLPKSYRTYCQVFGAGEFGSQFKVAVPGYQGIAEAYSLGALNTMAHEGQDYDLYSKDPEQHKRGLFVCLDILGSFHFFDPEEVSESRGHEYAIYTVFRDFRLKRAADNFWLFITECCLGQKHRYLIKSPAPKQIFRPVAI